MLYKRDWERAKEFWRRFWEGRAERPVMMVTAARDNPLEPPAPPKSLEERWFDPEHVTARWEYEIAGTYFGGESVPSAYVNLGPGITAAFLGSKPVFYESTVWFERCLSRLEGALELSFDRKNRYWRVLVELTDALLRRGEGKFVVGLSDLHGPSDHLSSLRGNQELCLDIKDKPDVFERALWHITELYWEVLVAHAGQILSAQDGTTNWQRWWAPGLSEVLQEDFADLLSLDDYRKFIQPVDEWLALRLQNSVFHIHETMTRFTEALSEIEGLKCIQWAWVGKDTSLETSLSFLKTIQSSGKFIYIPLSAGRIEKFIFALDPRKMIIVSSCESSAEADDLVQKVEMWSERRLNEL